jgi:threonylcarbamoyladenosine tRNA methylthiotransferase MtaB
MKDNKKIHITTLGCKVNQFESASFKTGFEELGCTVVAAKERADLVIINTCAVTAGAGAQSRQAIRRSLRKNPEAGVIITGCYAELEAKRIAQFEELAGRDYSIIGNSRKDTVVAVGTGLGPARDTLLGQIDKAETICRLPVKRFAERSRAYLRIQDGCENFCSYCIVPYTRGPSRSLPPEEVVRQAEIFAGQQHREIVLTGIHLGNYGKDLAPDTDLVRLLENLCDATPHVTYRISSLEPLEIDGRLLGLMAGRKNIQPHLHIPLQSGDDGILEKMNRRYSTAQFREVIDACHAHIPDLCIGIDILAGFPGETAEQFERAKSFLGSLNFSYLHVFPYSRRAGTPAAEMANQVDKAVKERRVSELLELSGAKQLTFNRGQLGRTRQVLVEGRRDAEGRLKGFTDNYIDVRLDGPDHLLGKKIRVTLLGIQDNLVLGEWREHES